jgi:tetratricopeptide (TPR) repeat protein
MKERRRIAGSGGRPAAAVEDILRRALAAIQSQRPAEAERAAGEVLARNPQHPGALHIRGLALLAQGRAREALVPLTEAAQRRPDPAIETHLAVALRQSDRADDAVEILERAITRQPPFPLAFHELGLVLFAARRLDEARRVIERGIAVAPAMPDLSVLLGSIFLDRAERANAKVAFARALANAPGHTGALYGLASVLMGEAEFASAADRLRQALARDPGYHQARLSLGSCLLELGRWDDAVACLRAVVKAAPSLYGQALQTLVTAGRGRFWLKPSALA